MDRALGQVLRVLRKEVSTDGQVIGATMLVMAADYHLRHGGDLTSFVKAAEAAHKIRQIVRTQQVLKKDSAIVSVTDADIAKHGQSV